MQKILKSIIQLIVLASVVFAAYLAAREWQRNKSKYKGSFIELKNKLGRSIKVESEMVQRETANLFSEAVTGAEIVKTSRPVQKAVDLIESALPGEQFPHTKQVKELSPRQNIIYAIIKGKKQVEMKDLLMRISGVTERTLRRDLLKLQALKLISKNGNTKAVTYVLK